MNTPQQHFSIADYLDVTEFILTEHNPDESEESSMPTIQIVVEANSVATPGSHPIQIDPSMISPLLKGLRGGPGEPPTEFELTLEITTEPRSSRKASRRKNTLSMSWMPVSELCDIIEDNHESSMQEEQSSEEQVEQTESEEQSESSQMPSPQMVYHSSRMDSMNLDFPTAEAIKKLQRLEQEEFKTNLIKLVQRNDLSSLMQFLGKYLTQDEIVELSPITQRTEDIIDIVNSKLRRIGTLTTMERREKVERYLFKRKNRIWGKKISYDCRKRVADARLRIKGRFITRKQASKILNMDVSHMSQNEIKELLDQKFSKKVRVW